MRLIRKLGITCASVAMASAPMAMSVAAEGGPPPVISYIGASAGCPELPWHISRIANPDSTMSMNGPIWFEDGRGASFASGRATAEGRFTLTVQKVSGSGPEGTITGQRNQDGTVDATATGSPCLSGKYHLQPGQTAARQ